MLNRHTVLVMSLAFCGALPANAVIPGASESQDNPYLGIVERNVFSLKPPPPPPDPEATKPPPPKITLTGIITIGRKQALMKTPPPPVKPGEQSKGEQSYILTEGERQGEIEVLEIDEKAGSVKVNNSGTIVTLTFEKDGPKLPASSAPVLPPGAVPPTGIIPPPLAPQQGGAVPSFPMPSRTLRAPGSAGAQPTPGTGIGSPGILSLNSSAAGSQTSSAQLSEQAIAAQRTPEENAILYEANRLKNDQLIQSGVHLPRMPPHPLLGGGQTPGPGQGP